MNRESSSNLSSNKGPTLWGILIAPTEQFERMVHRPRFGWALAAMMVVANKRDQMGRFTVPTPVLVFGWGATIVMALAAAAMLIF